MALYVTTCARNRGVVGGAPSHFVNGGTVVCIVEKLVVMGPTAETAVRACAPSLWRSAGGFVASAR